MEARHSDAIGLDLEFYTYCNCLGGEERLENERHIRREKCVF